MSHSTNLQQGDIEELYLLLKDRTPSPLRPVVLSGIAVEMGEALAQNLRQRLADEVEVSDLYKPSQDKDSSPATPITDPLPAHVTRKLKSGDRIGPYQLERALGEGGMGTVFLATRADDLHQRVAIKVLHICSPKLREQFRAECRILSSLKHPHIAHLVDAGENPDGSPWMAMEYVEGQTLHTYIAEQRPNLRQRLEIFLQLCDALTHAHRHMIIHRDLKPGNIMITPDGRTKLLDFGIAALLNPETGEQNTITMRQQRMMTPEYASPEQVNGLRLSAASDVYSLGVIFYELLTGIRPYAFKSKNPLDMVKLINTAPITKPSSATIDLDSGITRRPLKGDLDTIALMALERDPGRRYPSVEAVAMDVRNYLKGQPISARPATVSYRLKKYLQRHPWPVAMTALSALFLIAFALYANHQSQLNAQERDMARAERASAEAVSQFMVDMFDQVDPDNSPNREVSVFEVMEDGRSQLDQLKQDEVRFRLEQSMASVYTALGKYPIALELHEKLHNDKEQLGESTFRSDLEWIRTLLAAAEISQTGKLLDKIETQVEAQPLKEQATYWYRRAVYLTEKGRYPDAKIAFEKALHFPDLAPDIIMDIRGDRGRLFSQWGLYDQALKDYEAVLTYRKTNNGTVHSKVAETLLLIAAVHTGLGNYDKVMALHEQVNAINAALYDPDHPKHLGLGSSKVSLLIERGDYPNAETLARDILASAQSIYGKDHVETALAQDRLVNVLVLRAKFTEAETICREALTVMRGALGHSHPYIATLLARMGSIKQRTDDMKGALLFFQQSLTVAEESLGEDHPTTIATLNNLGLHLQRRGDLKGAQSYFQQALITSKKVLGEDHKETGKILGNLASVLYRMGKSEDALHHYKLSLEISKKVNGEDHPSTALALNNLGHLLDREGDQEKALLYFKQAHPIFEKTLGADHPRTLKAHLNIGIALKELGKFEEARMYLQQALDIQKQTLGDAHDSTLSTVAELGRLQLAMKDYEGAQRYYEQALKLARTIKGKGNLPTEKHLINLSYLKREMGDLEGARNLLKEVLDIQETHYGDTHRKTALSHGNMAVLLEEMGDFKQSSDYYEKAIAILKINHDEEHPYIAHYLGKLGSLLIRMEDFKTARLHLERSLEIHKKIRGEQHLSTATALSRLGNLHKKTKDFEEARTYLEQSLEIYKESEKEPYLKKGLIMCELAEILLTKGDEDTAADYLNKGVPIVESTLGKEHKKAQWARNLLEKAL